MWTISSNKLRDIWKQDILFIFSIINFLDFVPISHLMIFFKSLTKIFIYLLLECKQDLDVIEQGWLGRFEQIRFFWTVLFLLLIWLLLLLFILYFIYLFYFDFIYRNICTYPQYLTLFYCQDFRVRTMWLYFYEKRNLRTTLIVVHNVFGCLPFFSSLNLTETDFQLRNIKFFSF